MSSHPSFQIYLFGGAGIGISFLMKAITEYLQRVLRYPNQNLDQPSVLVTASTVKAATVINGITFVFCIFSPYKVRIEVLQV